MNREAEGLVWHLGDWVISNTVITTWLIMLGFGLLALLLRLSGYQKPSSLHNALEAVLVAIETAVADVVPAAAVRRVLPFVATLWLFVLAANLVGLLPEMHAPTRDLSATAALAMLVFLSTHWFGIRAHGLGGHLKHYCQPSVILLPFHIISEITRTLALAIRLFGNMMSLEMAALLVLLIAGFLVPVPLLMLHVVEAVIQAYIFGMLALIYIAGALESNEPDSSNREENL
ncbi:F0F1 ATP synthase subunit A [Methylomonas rivi]|uniref:ATP synthase subunit a n=1 Tax=Methylomonas rivi TaxID=2952226 RepID=A0ABT1U8F8_9GAMM|nr:F0F1 ATP synthase subunit A [Methylomonas sp. WSC-6]MCQ8130139.1 F0F1 ATP synthase subunit A [Methylomonas sp. WSC-6]